MTMKNTSVHKNVTSDDTIVCPTMRGVVKQMLAQSACLELCDVIVTRIEKSYDSIELCESIVAEVEHAQMCMLDDQAIDVTHIAVMIDDGAPRVWGMVG